MTYITALLFLLTLYLGFLAWNFYNQTKKIKSKVEQDHANQREQFYEVVHEFRAPLTAIKDAVSILDNPKYNLQAEERAKMMRIISSECKRLLEEVTAFLDASKVMTNLLVLQKTPNDLKNLLEEKIIMFSPQAQQAGISLAQDIDPSLTSVIYDGKYMNQVVNNLISNSLKYTPTGGKITVSAKTVKDSIVVSVFDNGDGIANEKQKALFAKFAQINAHDSTIPSTGIGLYVVKKIVEAHGGKVSVETQQARGYKISFTLPLSMNNPVSAPAVSPTPASA